jgi:hypothetical protein
MGRHSEITMEEFKDFIIDVKSVLDSLAQEIKIAFLFQSNGNFNVCSFLDDLMNEDPTFAINLQGICEKGKKDGWFEYFLNLRNQESHTGKINPIPFITFKMVRDLRLTPIIKKIEGEIQDPLAEGVPQNNAEKGDTIPGEVGLYLPDNPKEIDPKRITGNRKIKLSEYSADLTERINLVLKECYQQIGDEVDKIEASIIKKRCQRPRCSVRNCKYKKY